MDRWCEQNDTQILQGDTKTSQSTTTGYMRRPECAQGFTEQDFLEQNSNKLPERNWTYGSNGICEGDDAENCLASFLQVEEIPIIYTATPAKFATCTVRKSMSRIMRQIACMLTNPLNYLLLGHDLVDSALRPGCLHFPNTEIYNLSKSEELGWTKENGWVYTMVCLGLQQWKVFLRLQEIQSIGFSPDIYINVFWNGTPGYGCKHNCFECGANMTCFLEGLTRNLQKMSETRKWVNTETSHLMPLTWFCELYKTYDNYTFLKYDDDSGVFFKRELEPTLKAQNVSAEILTYIQRRMTSKRALHATNGFKLRSFLKDRILNSSYLIEMIVRLYYNDFKSFNFTLPTPSYQ
ncbi:hypothetical protein M3Y98_00064400 [Aphelenchoides besseyi]|nr:hypothetical protein M3Y98_00064400 [Aphelenchoides besseyi]